VGRGKRKKKEYVNEGDTSKGWRNQRKGAKVKRGRHKIDRRAKVKRERQSEVRGETSDKK